ncbi:MAG: prepilin-type N-terminal cleavage/methylation domain-containing protein [Phycisphaerae bacterium]|nr:prepilin-type N-terminal cleavage/methylation domain-containing protein [Phycisphaerae bacterium]
MQMRTRRQTAFTLIELLVVIAIISLLVSILLPALSYARQQGRAIKCLANMRTLGQGLILYQADNNDIFVPSRLPKMAGNSCEPYATLFGQRKYRPTFMALLSAAFGVPPFDDPQACKNTKDRFGEDGDRQNYTSGAYVCPSVPTWTDERNGCYAYNYQFLGNSRRYSESDTASPFKNWPVRATEIKLPGRTVAAGDGMGTAAWFAPEDRKPYDNNSKDDDRFGNEGFNLDPPWVEAANGEMANWDSSPQSRTAVDPRHRGRGNIVWADGHANDMTLEKLGYEEATNGGVSYDGENILWTGNGRDEPWLQKL